MKKTVSGNNAPLESATAVRESQSVEDYLERIHELIEAQGYARPIEIAAALNIKQSSVTKMMQRLHDKGYARYAKHRGLTLTPEGEEVARGIRRRHQYLAEFLQMLGVEEEFMERDIEGIEHHLSSPTMRRLEAFVDFLRDHPSLVEDFRRAKAGKPRH